MSTKTIHECPECGTPVGPGTGTSAYKHAVACLRVPDVGVDALLREYGSRTDTYATRVKEILSVAREGE